MTKTLRTRTRSGWETKPAPDLPENRLSAAEVDDNFLALEDAVAARVAYVAQAPGQPLPARPDAMVVHWYSWSTPPIDPAHPYDQWFEIGELAGPAAPAAPTGLVANGGDAVVGLTWTPSSSTGGAAPTGHRVYRATTNSFGAATQIGADLSSVAASYSDAAVTNGTTYYYWVSSFNTTGESSPTASAMATPDEIAGPIPDAPTGLTATGGDAQVALAWTASTSTEDAAPTAHTVYRHTANNFSGATLVTTLGAAAASYTNTGLTNDTTYYFWVTASNVNGESAPTAVASATPAAVSTSFPDLGWYAYWDAADLDLENDATITTWTDGTGGGRDMGVNTGTVLYKASTARLNNKPAAYFNGSGLKTANLGAVDVPVPQTFFLVFDGVNTRGTIVGSESASRRRNILNESGSTLQVAASASVLSAPNLTANAAHCAIVVFDGASSAIYLNNETPVTGAAGSEVVRQIWLGERSGSSYRLVGSIAFCGVINAVATSEQRAAFRAWAASEYGLTLS